MTALIGRRTIAPPDPGAAPRRIGRSLKRPRPNHGHPGVFVHEVDFGAEPIEGATTSSSGLVGATRRGPVLVAALAAAVAAAWWELHRRKRVRA